MAEHILKDTHNPKLNILECDRTTPLKQNLVPRFASAGDKKKRQGKGTSSNRDQDNRMGVKKQGGFGFGSSSHAFHWIEQRALMRASQSLVIERRDKANSF